MVDQMTTPFGVHDLFEQPQWISNEDLCIRLKARIKELVPDMPPDKPWVLTARVSTGRFVLGAQPIEKCGACGEAVWVDPSAMGLMGLAMFVCEVCLGEDLCTDFFWSEMGGGER